MPEKRKLTGPIYFPKGVTVTKCISFSRSRLKMTPHGAVKEIGVFNHEFFDYNDTVATNLYFGKRI